MPRSTDPLTMALPMTIHMWTLVNVHHYSYESPQPTCGVMKPHRYHEHEWMDEHFKMFSRWCSGICEYCFKDGVPEQVDKHVFGRGLHGNGAHK